jgi:single-stranded-DNA-specific exonuclease
MPDIVTRPVDTTAFSALTAAGIDARLARLLAARGIASPEALCTETSALIPPTQLTRVEAAAKLLADAIAAKKKLLIVADYDADGATACAVGLRALRAMDATVDYLVPNRFEYGYGLTPEIVQLAGERQADLLITVDNGIASVEGVAEANRLGMQVLVTDHHLPGAVLPDAACIVNPNQAGCTFPSKHLAGVGVIFYVMLALRSELRRRGAFAASGESLPASRPEPNLADLLDLVALGTVADVVKLDANNRLLIHQGLARIRAGRTHAGMDALLRIGGRDPRRAGAYDLGFVIGPRLNAAGRLDDMSLGIECLATDDPDVAQRIAMQLDQLNRERRSIESGMQLDALTQLDSIDPRENFSLCLYQPDWHQGVVGILASRIKDKFHRPVIAFARDSSGQLKGSGRSIPALHLRDALDLVTKRYPALVTRFGGHAMAAGLTLSEEAFPAFADAFEAVVREWLTPGDLEQRIETDGELAAGDIDFAFVNEIEKQVWGQGFPAPTFRGRLQVESQRVVGERHLKLRVALNGTSYDAMLFGHNDILPAVINAVYRLQKNEFRGETSLQLIIERWV